LESKIRIKRLKIIAVFLVREKCDGLTDIVFPGISVFG